MIPCIWNENIWCFLQALLEQHASNPLKISKFSVSDPVLYLDRLSAILSNINPKVADGQVSLPVFVQ